MVLRWEESAWASHSLPARPTSKGCCKGDTEEGNDHAEKKAGGIETSYISLAMSTDETSVTTPHLKGHCPKASPSHLPDIVKGCHGSIVSIHAAIVLFSTDLETKSRWWQRLATCQRQGVQVGLDSKLLLPFAISACFSASWCKEKKQRSVLTRFFWWLW